MEYDLEELKHKRKIMGISLRKTAAYMGCSYETVRLIENGILKNPYLISLYKKFIDGCWSGGISYEKAKNFCQHSTVSREEAQHLGAVREVLKINRRTAAAIIGVPVSVLWRKETGKQYMRNAEHDALYAFYLAEYQKIKRCFAFYWKEAKHDAD